MSTRGVAGGGGVACGVVSGVAAAAARLATAARFRKLKDCVCPPQNKCSRTVTTHLQNRTAPTDLHDPNSYTLTSTHTNLHPPDRTHQHLIMPSLHDLPTELIDQIHHHLEDLLINGRPLAEQAGVAADLGQCRLTSRYIERATRRSFVETWFGGWIFQAPDDASIEKFCTMAKTPDLAKAITEINFFVDDDYTMEVHEGKPDLIASIQKLGLGDEDAASSKTREGPSFTTDGLKATHVFDEVTCTMVPVAYYRNRDALKEAFLACENVTTLCFFNVPLDLRRLGRYKRECPDRRDDGGNDGEDANEDEDDEDADGDEDEDEDEDEDDGDNKDEDGHESEADAQSDRETDSDDDNDDNDDEEDENDEVDEQAEHVENEEDHDHRNFLFDITSSYFYVLFLAGQAGICPRKIQSYHQCSEHRACITLGLTDCAGLLKAKSALKKLETLKLDFIEDKRGNGLTPEEVYVTQTGKERTSS